MRRLALSLLTVANLVCAGVAPSKCRGVIKDIEKLVAANHNNVAAWRTPKGEAWSYDGGSYDSYFEPVLHGETFDGLARKAARPLAVLDVAGSAQFTLHPDLYGHLVGFRYGTRDDSETGADRSAFTMHPAPNNSIVYGNAFEPTGWAALDEHLATKDIKKFDLVIIRSVGPLIHLDATAAAAKVQPTLALLLYRTVNRSWARLDADGGQIFTELPYNLTSTEIFKSWLVRLTAQGINFEYRPGIGDKPTLRIKRKLSDPTSLPP